MVCVAAGDDSNVEIESYLKDRDEFERKKNGDQELITTCEIIAEEEAIIGGVKCGMRRKAALMSEAEYETPDELRVTYDGLARLCEDARRKGEEMTSELAALWLQQHEAVNPYVMTSTDQFLNIRGGAGVRNTYFMERLVRVSLDSSQPIALVAAYRANGRGTLRGHAE